MEKIFEEFTVSILKIGSLIRKIKKAEMKEYGLKSVHVTCIYFLAEREEGVTSGELMRLTGEDKAAISRAVKSLWENGLVERPAETYNAAIRLTEKGKKLAAGMSVKIADAVQAGSADMTEEERKIFYRTLSSVAENLENYYEKLEDKA